MFTNRKEAQKQKKQWISILKQPSNIPGYAFVSRTSLPAPRHPQENLPFQTEG